MDHSARHTSTRGSRLRRVAPQRTHRAKHASATGSARFAQPVGASPGTGAPSTSRTQLTVVASRVALVLGLAVILLAAQLKAPPNDRAAQEGLAAPLNGSLPAAPYAGTSSLLPQPSSIAGPAPHLAAPSISAAGSSSPGPSRGRPAAGAPFRPDTPVSASAQTVLSTPPTPSAAPSRGVDASLGAGQPSTSPGRTSPVPSRGHTQPPPSPPRYYLTDRYFSGERASACLAPTDSRLGARVVQRPCSRGASWTRIADANGRVSLHFSDSLCLGLPTGVAQFAIPLVLVLCGSLAEPRWGIDAQAHRVYFVGTPGDASPQWCVTGYDDASESGTFDDLLFPCSLDALNQDVTLLPAQE